MGRSTLEVLLAVLGDQLAPCPMSVKKGESPGGLGRGLLLDSNTFPGFQGEKAVTCKKQAGPESALKAARHKKEAIGS